MVVEDSSWSLIEHVLNGAELLMADFAQIHTLEEELSDHAVGILVGASLPWAVGVAKENVHFELGAEGLVQCHLRALAQVIVLRRLSKMLLRQRLKPSSTSCAVLPSQLDEHGVTTEPLDDRARRGEVYRPFDQVTIPMPGHDARCHLGRAKADVGHIGWADLARSASGARLASLVALAQKAGQFYAQRAAWHGADRAVDRRPRKTHFQANAHLRSEP